MAFCSIELDHGASLGMQAVINYDTLPNRGIYALEGTVRNTSCVTALLNVNATTHSGRIPLPTSVYLLLLDQRGMEDLLNPAVPRLSPAGGCVAGVNTTNCAFTASGLVPGQAYHLWLAYTGNSAADGLNADALVTMTFATSTSSGGLHLNLIVPRQPLDSAPCLPSMMQLHYRIGDQESQESLTS